MAEQKPEHDQDVVEEHRDPEVEERLRQRRLDQLMAERELAFTEEERVVMRWVAPSRPFKERSKEYFTTIGAIVILISIILLIAREFLLIAVVIAFAFVAYVLATVKPEEAEHEITTRGIRTGGKFFRWTELGRFWFSPRYGQEMLCVETFVTFPRMLVMMLGKQDQETLLEVLRRYLLNETPEDGFLDKASNWLGKKIPLEDA